MKIFIQEFFNPKLKCERIGHELKTVNIEIRKRSSEWREVVADYNATQNRCKRCGYVDEPLIKDKIDGYAGCNMASYLWKEMDSKGYIII